MEEQGILHELVGITRPVIELAVTVLGPIIVGWLGVKVASILNIKEEKDKAALEKAIRDAIHASAQNAWLFALKKAGLSFNEIAGMGDTQLLQTMRTAQEYVKDKNPEGLEKLGVTDQQLEDILLAKLPTSVRT
jgi:hypothetical protein